jgi:hypothetical protein
LAQTETLADADQSGRQVDLTGPAAVPGGRAGVTAPDGTRDPHRCRAGQLANCQTREVRASSPRLVPARVGRARIALPVVSGRMSSFEPGGGLHGHRADSGRGDRRDGPFILECTTGAAGYWPSHTPPWTGLRLLAVRPVGAVADSRLAGARLPLPPGRQEIVIQRVLVRHGIGRDKIAQLADRIRRSVDRLAAGMPTDRVRTGFHH